MIEKTNTTIHIAVIGRSSYLSSQYTTIKKPIVTTISAAYTANKRKSIEIELINLVLFAHGSIVLSEEKKKIL